MSRLTRKDLEARYKLFDRFSLNDQRNFYKSAVRKYRTASSQVNQLRALVAFLTGLSAALAGFIVQSSFVDGTKCALDSSASGCDVLKTLSVFFVVSAVVMPALGAFFSTLADLYQWDRQLSIYDSALENIEVADALSPLAEMSATEYRASLRAYTEGTLLVMTDETAQWGQAIRTPPSIEKFIAEEQEIAARVGGDADADAGADSTEE